MKTILFTLSVFIFTNIAYSEVSFVDFYRPHKGHFKSIRVPMFFDTDSITIGPQRVTLGQVYKIDYIATSSTTKLTAYQKYLNKKRWVALNEFVDIPADSDFEVNSIYQTGAKTEEEAKKLFHGYVIYYGVSAEKSHATAVNSIDDLVSKICQTKVSENTKTAYIQKSKVVDSTYLGEITVKTKKDLDRKLVKNNHVIEWGYDSLGTDRKYYGAYYILTKVSTGIFAAFTALADHSLFDMLQRSKINDNTLIVTDLTGSMYPYYSQLMVWHALKMSQGKKMHHIFFNDGDAKKTEEKQIGNTGGIYPTRSNDILAVYREMKRCMKGGYGGDGPENNFEAVLRGVNRKKDYDHVIMIADNWALPRDTTLVHKIEQPINFIMCGSYFGVNPEYLNLARTNQGRITTVETSIEGLLTDLKEGEELKVYDKSFQLNKGRFSRKI